ICIHNAHATGWEKTADPGVYFVSDEPGSMPNVGTARQNNAHNTAGAANTANAHSHLPNKVALGCAKAAAKAPPIQIARLNRPEANAWLCAGIFLITTSVTA